MASRVFFTFHYEDVMTFRANVVRKHSVTKEQGDAGFFDASIWEDAKRYGDESLRRRFLASGAAVLAAPLAADAQQAGKVPRIGFLSLTSPFR